MKLIKLVKTVIHCYTKNGEIQYSYWYPGDYTDETKAEKDAQEWCKKQNEEVGYKKNTFELVKLYGEVKKW